MKDNKQKKQSTPEATPEQAPSTEPTTEDMGAEEPSFAEQQQAKIEELTNDLQRTRADFENYRRQNDMLREQDRNYARLDTVKKMLPLVDDFERAIMSEPEKLAPLAKSFEKTLKDLGLTKIQSDQGTEFDPDLHEAISVDGDGEKEEIAETLRAGYYYNGEVLRTAMVRVSKV